MFRSLVCTLRLAHCRALSGENDKFGRSSCLWPSQRLVSEDYAPAHVVEGLVATLVFVSIAAAYYGDTVPCRREELAELAWLAAVIHR